MTSSSTPPRPQKVPTSANEAKALAEVAQRMSRTANAGILNLSDGEKRELDAHARRSGVWWPINEMPPIELQHVWFDLNRVDDWRSLAIVPQGPRAPALAVAHAFARMASLSPSARVLVVDATPGNASDRGGAVENMADAVRRFPGTTFDFLDATSLGLNEGELSHIYVPQLLTYINGDGARYNKVIIALGDILDNAQSIPIARTVDAVLVAVQLGTARAPDVTRVVEIIGRERVKGAVAVEHVSDI